MSETSNGFKMHLTTNRKVVQQRVQGMIARTYGRTSDWAYYLTVYTLLLKDIF